MPTYFAIPYEKAQELGLVAEDKPDYQVSSPAAAIAHAMARIGQQEQEYLLVIMLNARNVMIDSVEVYHGSLTISLIRTGEVFKEAIKANAAGVIISHNHPSGDPSPSPEDLAVTRNLVEAGRLLDIPVLDHVIVSASGKSVSMREQGMGFGEK